MNASEFEQELALKNGVIIRHWLQPRALTRNERGEVCGITLDYTTMNDGRLETTGESVTLASDQIFKAIGRMPAEKILAEAGMALSRGRISVDEERRTSIPGIWAGGDCIAGGQDLTVAGVQDGKLAAKEFNSPRFIDAAGKSQRLCRGSHCQQFRTRDRISATSCQSKPY